jgi:hypothetical protein
MSKQTVAEFLVKFREIPGKLGTTSDTITQTEEIKKEQTIAVPRLTPKQKAEELYACYCRIIAQTNKEFSTEIVNFSISFSILAKECALIGAKECQKEMSHIGHYDYCYWEEVIGELEMI